MSNERKRERRAEIARLHLQGRQAFEAGKSMHTAPSQMGMLNRGHWLDGYRDAEHEKASGIQAEAENAHESLLDAVRDVFVAVPALEQASVADEVTLSAATLQGLRQALDRYEASLADAPQAADTPGPSR